MNAQVQGDNSIFAYFEQDCYDKLQKNMEKMGTSATNDTSFDLLREKFEIGVTEPCALNDTTQDVLSALRTDAFRNGFEFQPIYGKDDILGYEALARPQNKERKFSIQALADEFYTKGQHEEFDLFTLSHVLSHSRNQSVVTVNVSPKALLSPKFCDMLIEKLQEYNRDPKTIILEVLEHDVAPKADVSHLKKLEDLGVRIALDDFGEGQSHFNRLAAFRPHLRMIKIDGSLIESLSDSDLKDTCDVLKQAVPGVVLVAEHVQDFDQTARLFALGFDGVQGNKLQAMETQYIAKILGTQRVDLEL